jgi:hypothetical protein
MSGDIVGSNRFHLRPIYATNVFGEVIAFAKCCENVDQTSSLRDF